MRKMDEVTELRCTFNKKGKLYSTSKSRYEGGAEIDNISFVNKMARDSVIEDGTKPYKFDIRHFLDAQGNVIVPVFKDCYDRIDTEYIKVNHDTKVCLNTTYNKDSIEFEVHPDVMPNYNIDKYCHFKRFNRLYDIGDDMEDKLIESVIYKFKTPADDIRTVVYLQVIEFFEVGDIMYNIIISYVYSTGYAIYEICNVPQYSYENPDSLVKIIDALYDDHNNFMKNINRRITLEDIDNVITSVKKNRVIVDMTTVKDSVAGRFLKHTARYERTDNTICYDVYDGDGRHAMCYTKPNPDIENTVITKTNENKLKQIITEFAKVRMKGDTNER